ncbi:SDR family NAD(P)-dependent oxidoreductase [Gammaproteobacteria bacterium]
MSTPPPDYRALMTKALLEIKELKSQLQIARQRDNEAIAIVGAACRFPSGANTLTTYWNLLVNGRDGIGMVPAERWPVDDHFDPEVDAPGKICSRYGGFIDQPVGDFDAAFFGISPREAQSMDPQQRLLLELCWEALEHANYVPEQLFQSNSGVFIGVSSLDHATRVIGEAPFTDIDGYYGTGCALAPIAGRISYLFGFTGPSFIVDTACSSSLLSLHLACESLRRRECDLALGGGIQLLTHPGISIAFTKARMLSVDGRCKTFDAAANGYVRGEGGGIVVLKRLGDALRDGDTILALIRGSAVNQDGPSGGLTVPSGPSQEAVIRQALIRGGIDPSHVNYIEAHGTGTPLGDPIEVGAMHGVFGNYRSSASPLWIGSVKTNIGHLEAGAGIASVIKTLLSLRHRTLVPHLHFTTPNPLIPWKQLPIRVPTAAIPWSPVATDVPLTAGVSSFGFSGTNVHLVMSEAPPVTPLVNAVLPYQLFVLAARDEPALHELARRYVAWLADANANTWPAIAHTAAVARTHFQERLALAATTADEARARLTSFAANRMDGGMMWRSAAPEGHRPKVALLFSGQGSQYCGMGESLYRAEPLFRGVIDRCDQVLRPVLGQSLPDLLFTGGAALDQTGNTQPALYALEVALATLWQAWGGTVAAVLGHSVGEYAAAAVAGIFSIEDGARLIAERARLMQALPSGGGMMAVLASRVEVEAQITKWAPGEISIAADNGPSNVVISGAEAVLRRIQEHFVAANVECRSLSVSHAFHSPLMTPVLAPFRTLAATIRYQVPRLPIYSNVTGRRESGERLTNADYWIDHIRQPVQFQTAFQALLDDGCNLLVEAGPRPTLLGMGRAVAGASGSPLATDAGAWLPLLRHGQPEWQQILSTLGGYWCRGGTPDWSRLGSGRAELPTYPFQRRRHWHEVTLNGQRQTVAFHGEQVLNHPLLARRLASKLLSERLYETPFSKKTLPLLEDHRVFDELVVAGATHLSLIIGAALVEDPALPLQLRRITFPQALVITEESERRVQLALTPASELGSVTFRLVSFADGDSDTAEPAVHASGQITRQTTALLRIDWSALRDRCHQAMAAEQLYQAQAQRRIVVGPSYRWLREVWRGSFEAIAQLQLPDNISGTTGYELHPGLIDSCFGLLVINANLAAEETIIPFSMEALTFHQRVTNEPMRAHARLRGGRQDGQRLVGDVWLETISGEPIASFIGLEGRKASRAALLALIDPSSRWLYQRQWRPLTLPDVATTTGAWLLCCDRDGCGATLAQYWRAAGRQVIEVGIGAALTCVNNHLYQVDPNAEDQLRALFARLPTQLAGVIDLWPLDAATIDWSAPECQQRQILGTSLALLKTMALTHGDTPLFFISNQGCAVTATDTLPAPQMATLSGLLRSASAEYPQWRMALIDLESRGIDAARQISDGVSLALSGELLVACRNGQFHGERLQPYRLPVPDITPLATDHGYLITGGTGALGLAVANWLVEQGVRYLLLLACHAPEPAALSAIERLRIQGARVETVQVDVGDFIALEAVLKPTMATLPSIRGVIHLAGQIDDGPLAAMNWPQAYHPLAAKLAGAWNLHRLTAGQPLEIFLLFSSMTSLIGSATQGNYAAANAALDALAEHRRRTGLAGLAVNWGPWAEIGMAARLDSLHHERLRALGIDLLPPTNALRVLGDLLRQHEVAQVAVTAIDWERYPDAMRPLTAHLRQGMPPTVENGGRLLQKLRELPTARRRSELLRYLGNLLSEVLRMEKGSRIDPRERLFDIGVDSLMAMELKNRLQHELAITLSVTLLFDYPNLDALTDYLLDNLLKATLQRDNADADESNAMDLAGMSEEDAEAELLLQLARVETP